MASRPFDSATRRETARCGGSCTFYCVASDSLIIRHRSPENDGDGKCLHPSVTLAHPHSRLIWTRRALAAHLFATSQSNLYLVLFKRLTEIHLRSPMVARGHPERGCCGALLRCTSTARPTI